MAWLMGRPRFQADKLGESNYLPAMAADEWIENLQCPLCGKKGRAALSQHDYVEMPTIQFVPDGFKVVRMLYGPVFHCTTCDVPVAVSFRNLQ
jgi:hypothetical protein